MAAAEDEDPVEAVGANRAHPTLGEGVCVRRLDWRADQVDALRPKGLVERVYAGSLGPESAESGTTAVSQYDVACFQVSQPH